MKVLRMQYLKLQNNVDGQKISSKNNMIEKSISNVAKEQVKTKQTIAVAEERTLLNRGKNVVCFDLNSSPNMTKLKIFCDNIDESLKSLNIIVEFTDTSAMWLTNLYKTYENDLWCKRPRLDSNGNRKWFFYCGFCGNVYHKFASIKGHLNLHLNIYPYMCKICPKKYTNRKSATKHLKKIHQLNRLQFNDFLTS